MEEDAEAMRGPEEAALGVEHGRMGCGIGGKCAGCRPSPVRRRASLSSFLSLSPSSLSFSLFQASAMPRTGKRGDRGEEGVEEGKERSSCAHLLAREGDGDGDGGEAECTGDEERRTMRRRACRHGAFLLATGKQ